MIEEYVLGKGLDLAIKKLKELRKEVGLELDSDTYLIKESLNIHLQKVKNWARVISFDDIKKSRKITDVFIHLDLEVMPRRKKFKISESVSKIPLLDLLNQKRHIVLLGQPGAGKTTSMKYFCHKLLFDDSSNNLGNLHYPILIKFRNLQKSKNQTFIFKELTNIFGFSLSLKKTIDKKKLNYNEAVKKFMLRFLDTQNILIILDGFDEIPNTESKEIAKKEIEELTNFLDSSKIILTSRSGDFYIHVPNAKQFEIAPLSDSQILNFSIKWLGSEKKGEKFKNKVKNSPFADSAVRPLTLAHLCAIYQRIGHIPDKPNSVYKKVIKLLIEEWDQQRSIERVSKYAEMEVDRKFRFLSNLSFELTTHIEKTIFSSQDLERIYEFVYQDFNLEKNECRKVVQELETHTGLIIKVSHDSYQFAHKSLQEYLAADSIVRSHKIPSDEEILLKLPNELAIAVTIASYPSTYFSELIDARFAKMHLTEDFIAAFLNRLLLEKPDFNKRTTVLLSLFNLYRIYIESGVNTENQRQIIKYNNIEEEFELLIRKMLERNPDSIQYIKREYSIFDEINLGDGKKLLKYKNYRNSTGPKFIILPSELI